MKGEINKDFYCSCGFCIEQDSFYCPLQRSHEWTFDGCLAYKEHDFHFGRLDQDGCCYCLHRKHPTLKQFKEEYGEEYGENGAVWLLHFGEWTLTTVETSKYWIDCRKEMIVCVCTPFGKPDADWRP